MSYGTIRLVDADGADDQAGEPRGLPELAVVTRSRGFSAGGLEWIVIVLGGAARMWLAPRALQAIGWSTYDDRWFVERARDILAGEWLGAYDHMTLIKGAGYPLWIAFCNVLGIPLLFMQHLLYVLACLGVCRALAPVMRAPLWRASMFLVLAFNPMTFADDIGTRASREGIYPALTLLLFAACVNAVLRLDAPPARRVFYAAVSGFAVAIFWITREEGVWILPLLVFTVLAVRSQWRRSLTMVTVAAAAFAAIYGSVVLANALRYGVATAVEVKERSFLRAYGSLASVRQRAPQPRVPVPQEVRERAYAISPAFAELRPFLEGPATGHWRCEGGDICGAYFFWALRDAVAGAGHYRTATSARAFYDRVSAEIERARQRGLLDARPARGTLLPPLLPGQIRQVLKTWIARAVRVPAFRDFSVAMPYSEGTDDELALFASVTRSRLAPRQEEVVRGFLVGWVVHVDGALDLTVERGDGSPAAGARVTRLPSPDLYEHLRHRWKEFPPARHARFRVDLPPGQSFLVLSLRGKEIERIAMTAQPRGSVHPDVRMSIEKVAIETERPQLSPQDAFRLQAMQWIGATYGYVAGPFFILATIAFLLRLRHVDGITIVLVGGLLTAVAARVLILALIDVSSFVVFTPGYQTPMYPLVLIAAMLMAHGATATFRAGDRIRRAEFVRR